MKCRFCGTLLPDDAKFCPGCGREVEKSAHNKNVMDSNTPEDAYYREIDDEEYVLIKKKEKEEERAKEEAAKQRAEEQKRKKEEEKRKKLEMKCWKAEQERQKLYEKSVAREERTVEGRKKSSKDNKNKKQKKQKKSSGISVIAYFVIILVGGFALYKTGIVGNVISKFSTTSTESKGSSKTTSKSGQAKKTEFRKTTESTEKKEHKKTALADTDNDNMNVDACLSPEDYNTVTSKDGSFSFGYPKYLFSGSEVNEEGTSYTLSYKGDTDKKKAELVVYTEENSGNPLENAKELYSRFSSAVYKTYFKMQPTRIDSSGMARTLIGASVDSSETEGTYIIAANDGEKNYILKFTYPDPDMSYDYNEIDYVVDCIYRYCSFSGGTYQPRTYQQFLKDDMGMKK